MASAIADATDKLSKAVQDNMAIGEEEKTLVSDYASVVANLVDPVTASEKAFKPPQSDMTKFNEEPTTTFTLEAGDSLNDRAAVGVSVIQLTNKKTGSASRRL